MKRTDAAGATAGNLFTNGNPSLSIPATTVDSTILNAIQEEIVAVVLDSGQSLDQTNVNLGQLLTAINKKVNDGGVQLSQAIVNNQAAAADITALVFDSNNVKSATIEYDIHRQSDTGNSELDEKGTLHALFDSVAGTWKISQQSFFDDSLVVFTVTGSGQIQYTSSDIAGSNSVGTMKMIVRTINQ